jgi:hypothetical protein
LQLEQEAGETSPFGEVRPPRPASCPPDCKFRLPRPKPLPRGEGWLLGPDRLPRELVYDIPTATKDVVEELRREGVLPQAASVKPGSNAFHQGRVPPRDDGVSHWGRLG